MREIVVDDIAFIIKCLQALRIESPVYNECADDPSYVSSTLSTLLSSGSFYGVIEDGRGFLLGSIGQSWYSATNVAYENLLYVLPEYRRSRTASQLIKEFVSQSWSKGADEIRAGASTGINEDLVLRLFISLGFTRLGAGVRLRK